MTRDRRQQEKRGCNREAPRKPGRPSIFTQTLADEICGRLSEGESLRSISRDPEMPATSTMMEWALKRPEFSEQYARARKMGCDYLADEIIDIADDSTNDFVDRVTRDGTRVRVFNRENFERSRLRVDVRKWALARMLPKKYGDRYSLRTADEEPIKITVEERNKLIDSIIALVHPKDDPTTKPGDRRHGEAKERSRKAPRDQPIPNSLILRNLQGPRHCGTSHREATR